MPGPERCDDEANESAVRASVHGPHGPRMTLLAKWAHQAKVLEKEEAGVHHEENRSD